MAFKSSQMMTSLKTGSVTADNSYLTHNLYCYIQSLTTPSVSRPFGLEEEHWTFNPAARVQINHGIFFHQSDGIFFILICYACFFVTAFMS